MDKTLSGRWPEPEGEAPAPNSVDWMWFKPRPAQRSSYYPWQELHRCDSCDTGFTPQTRGTTEACWSCGGPTTPPPGPPGVPANYFQALGLQALTEIESDG